MMKTDTIWSVYIVRCVDGTLYTGVSSDSARRVKEHNSLHDGAKYTRTRQPVALVYVEVLGDKGTALSREYALKQLPRGKKLELVKEFKRQSIKKPTD